MGNMSAAEEIAKFFELLKIGAITESEFAAAKATLIGGTQTSQNAAKGNPIGAGSDGSNKAKPSSKLNQNNSRNGQKFPSNLNPVQTGIAVAAGVVGAGVVGGRLISDRLLDDPSTDPAAFTTETITFPDGDIISGSAVEMPNGDFFYSITESTESNFHTMTGSLTAEEVQDLNHDYSEDHGGSYHHHHETSTQVSESDSGNFENYDFF